MTLAKVQALLMQCLFTRSVFNYERDNNWHLLHWSYLYNEQQYSFCLLGNEVSPNEIQKTNVEISRIVELETQYVLTAS